MTYPASPTDVAPNRVRPDSAQFWAGGVATAVVAALIALVGILVCRWTLKIPILAPARDGAWGSAHTGEYVLVAAVIALVATGLLYLLVLGTTQPGLFFRWIMGLATVAAAVYPFSTSAPLDQKAATAIVNLVLGIAITSLLVASASRAVRRTVPANRVQPGTDPRYPAGQDPRYAPAQDPRYAAGQDPRYAAGQPSFQPTEPLNAAPDPQPRQNPDNWR